MKIAFFDWLTGMRGGEWCLEAAYGIFPDADIYARTYFRGRFSGDWVALDTYI